MQTYAFPTCCGANILTGFGNTANAIDQTKYTLQQISDFLDDNQRSVLAFSMIILNEDQVKVMKGLLKEKSWKCLARNLFHPSHKSHLFIYIREWNKNHYANTKNKK